jgi:oxygen-independent coproporphyrinogen-3 oxidase
MAGLYIHVPFCRKICSYCDFYKTTATSLVPDYLSALDSEMTERAAYLEGESLETIYFGGGTPSLIPVAGLQKIFERIYKNFRLAPDCEITIEANPDDLSSTYLQVLRRSTPVNRLSVGIQSFSDHDLNLLNRRHNAKQALQSIKDARNAGFRNITIDLIYGLPDMDLSAWRANLEIAFLLDVQHLSAYHLTIEPNTALSRMTSRGLIHLPEEGDSADQFLNMALYIMKSRIWQRMDICRSITAITGSRRNILASDLRHIHSTWFHDNGMWAISEDILKPFQPDQSIQNLRYWMQRQSLMSI